MAGALAARRHRCAGRLLLVVRGGEDGTLAQRRASYVYEPDRWARTYLRKAAYSSRRDAVSFASQSGQEGPQRFTPKIDVKFLEQFDEFLEFKSANREKIQKNALDAACLEGTLRNL